MSDKTYQVFKKGELCLRCGSDKKFERKYKLGCSVYAKSYPTHLWNKEEVEVEVQEVSAPKYK